MPIIKNNLIELCKQIKRKLQREGDHNKESTKAKPLIHVEQENHLRNIIRHFATTDDHMLLEFMRLIQSMLRGMIYNNYLEQFTRFTDEFICQANGRSLYMGAPERYFKISLIYQHKEQHDDTDKHSKYSLSPTFNEFLKSLDKKIQDQLLCLNKFKILLEEQNRVEFNP